MTDESGATVIENLTIGTVGNVTETVDLTELSGERATIEVHADGVNLSAEFTPGAHGANSDRSAVQRTGHGRSTLSRLASI